ncbi:MAG: ABC transporter ATP-binding protein [Candidatus Heimdallarchaeota archaeon]|nr:ABC transporter ATP-binding protein [Candidatus Heimdallarchaeota archaeon]
MNIVEIKNLSKSFGDNVAYSKIDLEIKKGEVFGLLGPNGAGKTTLIRSLIGLIKPDTGSMSIFGLDVEKDIMEIRSRLALLPQECQAYDNLTAYENIYYFGQIHGTIPDDELKRRTEELIDIIGLKGREHDLVKKFSGGMKRKVLVARALVVDPELVFLDEPTTAIDILGARTVRNLIKKMAKEMHKTVILTTHDMSEIEQLCDRVGIIVNGELVAVGTPDHLEEQFKKADLEDVFVALATGEIGNGT